ADELVVDSDLVRARTRTLAGAQRESPEIGCEPDEVELCHARSWRLEAGQVPVWPRKLPPSVDANADVTPFGARVATAARVQHLATSAPRAPRRRRTRWPRRARDRR